MRHGFTANSIRGTINFAVQMAWANHPDTVMICGSTLLRPFILFNGPEKRRTGIAVV